MRVGPEEVAGLRGGRGGGGSMSEVIEQGSGTPGIPRGDARQHVSMIGQHDHRGWGRQPIPSGKASSLPAQVKGSSISEKVTKRDRRPGATVP